MFILFGYMSSNNTIDGLDIIIDTILYIYIYTVMPFLNIPFYLTEKKQV